MAGAVEGPQRMSGWELRERMKKTRSHRTLEPISKIESSPSSARSLSGIPTAVVVNPNTPEPTPLTFRTIVAGRKIRRSSGITPVLPRKDQSRMRPSQRDLLAKGKEDSDLRKSTLGDSFTKLELDLSRSEHHIPKRRNSAMLKTNPYAPKKSSSTWDDESVASSCSSLDSNPPPERELRSSSLHDRASWHRSTSSFEAALDLSESRILDISEHGSLVAHNPIITGASDEQWARFKLLGRIGLGNIRLSREAQQLVDRNFEIMLKAIKSIMALREDRKYDDPAESIDNDRVLYFRTGHLLEEVQETIPVPIPAKLKRDPNTISINDTVQAQLKDFITVISSMYRDNAFHDFEHASNVLQAVGELIERVQPPDDTLDCHDLRYGCGVATEPWNRFALVFSALIHDVDHHGVPNAQLIKEKSHVAGAYKNRSVAEQNSIELSWNILMEPCYKELRETIFWCRSELITFRSLVVTAVLATDIADKELAALRKGRAAKALREPEVDVEHPVRADLDLVSRKATFVVETLIQVADVSHTMSSFSTYKKWNHRLYKEMYEAYKNGRAEKDPTETWYRAEFGFLDFYIIPLAKKLKKCGIFGSTSDEYLKNAMENRRLWEAKGESIVQSFVEKRKAEEAAKARTISLHEMALDASSSDESDFDDFAEDSDIDNISISSNDSDSPPRVEKCAPSLATKKTDQLKSKRMETRIPSKASCEQKQPKRIMFRSKSAEISAHEKKMAENKSNRRATTSDSAQLLQASRGAIQSLVKAGFRLRSRSKSPGSGSECSGARTAGTQGGSRSKSPGSGSERSEPRMTVKVRSRSKSPQSQTNISESKPLKIKRKGRKPSRSVSPASSAEQSEEQSKLSSTKVVRRGRRPSRSRSPVSNAERSPGDVKSETDLKKGRRPTKVKSKSSSAK